MNQEHELKVITRAKTDKNGNIGVRTPQFPGLQGGKLSIEQVRAIIRRQKLAKGFRFGLTAGTNESLQLKISGTARTFLGFAILERQQVNNAVGTQMTITINNEIVINQVPPEFFSPDFMDDEYYFFLRPLSGQDEILLDVTLSNDTEDFLIIVYYI